MQVTQVLVLLSVVVLCRSADNVGCRSDSDCYQGQCCAYVVGKYGATSCQSLRGPQEQCRPEQGPTALTVSAPGGPSTPVRAHYMVCPCARGLSCQQGACAAGLPYGSEEHPAQVARPRL